MADNNRPELPLPVEDPVAEGIIVFDTDEVKEEDKKDEANT